MNDFEWKKWTAIVVLCMTAVVLLVLWVLSKF